MRLFFVASNLPSPGHSVRAATVLVREVLLAVRALGHEIVFQPLPSGGEHSATSEEEAAAITWARGEGFELLPTIRAPEEPFVGRTGLALQALSSSPERFFPAYALRDELAARVRASGADAVFHLWSAPALAACSTVDRPVFAYYGNPDHKPIAARLEHPEIFGVATATWRNRARLAMTRAANRGRKRAHLRLMRRVRWCANVCAIDAEFYRREVHPDAFYIQNMWLTSAPPEIAPELEEGKIAGNLGGLYATGNSFGLWFLAREIVPALERRLGDGFSVHVFGAGEPTRPVAEALRVQPAIRVRGFVDDIDAELRSSNVFLLANNNNPDFVVGHTRILHAWSLGMCMVAHRNTALAMPEVVHGENALLGESADEMAELTAQALADADLRRAIGEGGRRTLERDFTPAVVMERVLARIAAG